MKKLLSLALIALSVLTASAFAESVTTPVASTQHVAKKHRHHWKSAKKHHKHKKHRHHHER